MAEQFGGVVGRTMSESRGWWPPLVRPPANAPNVIVIVLDDVGFAQLGCYGSDLATPTFDALASEGLRFTNFHTTALCSPTRACLLSGRNHHSNGMGRVVELAAGFPGYNAHVPKENGFLSEILRDAGYATFLVGKWHLTPAAEIAAGATRARWPLSRGFERFYGFMGGETDQFHPELVRDSTPVGPPRPPEDGYHLTEDLVDNAIRFISDLRGATPDRPFFLWFAPGACHAPHQAPKAFIDQYRGRFDLGWDRWREEVFARQLATGVVPAGTRLPERPSWVTAWDDLSPDERTVAGRLMEAFGGFMTHTDRQVERLLSYLSSIGERENTLVVLLSDNGASAEGGPRGLFNEQYFFNFVPESLEENLRRLDDIGTPAANNHYPWGWAWAGNTPLKRFKRDTHEGGVTDPLIVHWPAAGWDRGAIRHQYVHAIDLMPTVLDLLQLEAPTQIAGVAQSPVEGVSFAPALRRADGASQHHTQYYEMLGSRALYHDGWKAVVFHTPPFIAYDGSDVRHSFDEDVWELYHVDQDFSEYEDLSATHPEKLAELQALWWREAERFQVLPLNNEPGLWGDPRYRRNRFEFVGPAGPMAEGVAPHLKNRSFTITAVLAERDGAYPDGVIVAHGSHAGGYVLAVRGGRLQFTYNFVTAQVTRVQAEAPLPAGLAEVAAVVTRSGAGATVELRYGDVPVAEGEIPVTTPLTYGSTSFSVGFQSGGAIDPTIPGRAELAADVLRRVVIESYGTDPIRDPLLEPRAELATQ